jgi:hypothetical protein
MEGRFLPLLAGLASSILSALMRTALPALATGAFAGLDSNVVGKIVGKGNYFKAECMAVSYPSDFTSAKRAALSIKKGGCCKVQKLGTR